MIYYQKDSPPESTPQVDANDGSILLFTPSMEIKAFHEYPIDTDQYWLCIQIIGEYKVSLVQKLITDLNNMIEYPSSSENYLIVPNFDLMSEQEFETFKEKYKEVWQDEYDALKGDYVRHKDTIMTILNKKLDNEIYERTMIDQIMKVEFTLD